MDVLLPQRPKCAVAANSKDAFTVAMTKGKVMFPKKFCSLVRVYTTRWVNSLLSYRICNVTASSTRQQKIFRRSSHEVVFDCENYENFCLVKNVHYTVLQSEFCFGSYLAILTWISACDLHQTLPHGLALHCKYHQQGWRCWSTWPKMINRVCHQKNTDRYN